MDRSIITKAQKILSAERKRKKWMRIVGTLACVVVFCTTYALILPAITQETQTWCGYEEHTHGENCYVKSVVCGVEETAHTHTESCEQTESILVCELTESEGHTHSDACKSVEEVLTCTQTEDTEHVHETECYTQQETMICGQEESEGHQHEDACYQESTAYVCGLEEGSAHSHTDECYEEEIICTLEEHEHTLICSSNPDADVEDASVWESTIPKNLTGVWADDIISAAESQLGYTESTENYIVAENGEIKGYTRYGAWYGDSYGDWAAMFVSFCLNYTDIPEEAVVREADCEEWVTELKSTQQYLEKANYVPEKGDLIFFDLTAETDGADHVGLVVQIDEDAGTVKTIEGDSDNKVQYVTYALNDTKIAGYGELPENPKMQSEDTAAAPLNNAETEEAGENNTGSDTNTEEEQTEEDSTETTTAEFAGYITNASVGELTAEGSEYLADVTIEFSVPAADTVNKVFVYTLPEGLQIADSLIGTTKTVQGNDGTETFTCEFIEDADGTHKIQIAFNEEYITSQQTGSVVGSFTFIAALDESKADANGVLKIQFTDSVSTEVSFGTNNNTRASTIPAGKYGNYNFSYNEETDAFTNDPAYADYYNYDSPLGVAGSFHIVAFDTATLNTHTNGNILAHTLIANSNFGTNGYDDELSYAFVYKTLNSTSASMTDHVLVIGSDNKVTVGGNNDNLYINGTKIDKPYNIVQDVDSSNAPFIDLTKVHVEIGGISSRLNGIADRGVTADFSDQNNRSINLDNPNSVGYYSISASELNNYANNPLRLKGFTKNGDGTLIINVDCSGVTQLNMPAATIFIDGQEQSTNEVTEFSNGKVVWNFVNASGVTINTNRMTGMVIALGATVNINQNLNGTVIAEFVNVKAESHRTDFTGQIELIDDEGESEKASIGIRKVDADNISIYLADAEFTLYRWDETSGEYIEVFTKKKTDANGLLSITDLNYNRAYKLVETTAPSGYILGTEPYEFYVPNSDTITYPERKPDDFNGEAHSERVIKNIKNKKSESEMVSITIEKEWYIDNTQITSIDGMIEVDIYQKVFSDEERTVKAAEDREYTSTVSIDSHQGWSVTISNLPAKEVEKINGKEQTVYYSYYVVEEPVRGYEASYENNDGIISGTITVKNTSNDDYETTELTLNKQWFEFDGTSMEAPENSSVTVKLYQTAYEDQFFHHEIGTKTLYGDPIELSEENEWTYTFTELPEYEVIDTDDGKQTVYYRYTAEEEEVGGFADTYDNNNSYEGTIVIKNTQKDHPTKIYVEKQWLDADGKAVEKSGEIKFDLYQKVYGYVDEETYDESDFKGDKLYKEDITLSSEDEWKTEVSNLPLHGWMLIDGESVKVAYTYYIQEEEIEGYKTTYENNRGITGQSENAEENTITIINKAYSEYSLPETGGIGTDPFMIGGCLMMAGSLAGYSLRRRRKEVQ